MTSSSHVPSRLGAVALAASLTVAVACDTNDNWRSTPHLATFAGPLATSPLFTTSIVPQRLGITPLFGVRCPTFPSVTTRFDLVVNLGGGSDLFMQQVTIRLLDGSSLGGSPLLVSASDLAARFGSTLIRASTRRTFGFDPQFGCSPFLPRSLAVDLLLLDRMGTRLSSAVIVPIE